MADSLRQTGLDLIGDVPWGTHFCQFYDSRKDLADILVPYFKTGLENNEFCMWVTSKPLDVRDAENVLRVALPDVDDYIDRGQLVILDYSEWYTTDGGFDSDRVLAGWVAKLTEALDAGYDGLRLTGNTFWLEKSGWDDFVAYEAAVDSVIGGYNMMALCTYPLKGCNAKEILDVIRNHEFALVKTGKSWERIERGITAKAKREMTRLASFPTMNPNPVIEVDLAGRVTFANPISQTLFPDLAGRGTAHPLLADWDRVVKELPETSSGYLKSEIQVGAQVYHLAFKFIPEDRVVRVYATDITERAQAEEALRETERRVRQRLEDLLAAPEDIGSLELADIIDVPATQALVNDFYAISGIPMALIDLRGAVIINAGWQDICTRFHRANPQTERLCIDSTVELTKGIPEGEFKLFRCKNGMWYMTTPVIVGGQHLGNLFCGQMFFNDETVDREYFRTQAGKYGFAEEEYLAALDRVPRISRAAFDLGLRFYRKLADALSQLSYSNVRLVKSLTQRNELTAELIKGEERLDRAQGIAQLGSWELDIPKNRLTWSNEVYRIFGLEPREFDATYDAFLEAVHPEDRAMVDAAYADSLRTGRDSYEITHRVVRKSTGEIRIVEEKCQHYRDETGQVVRSVGMVQDVTERHKVDAFLQAQVWILSAANQVESTMDEVVRVVLDASEAITSSAIAFFHFVLPDQETLMLQGWSTNTVRNMCAAEGKGQHYPLSVAGVWAEAFYMRAPVVHNDYSRVPNRKGLPEGHAPITRELVLPIIRNDIVVAIIGVGNKAVDYDDTDVKSLAHFANLSWEVIDRKRAEEALRLLSTELQAANAELQAFAYSVSHDLRAPLRTIDGFSQALLEDYASKLDATGVDYLNRLRSGSQKMARLIDDLLDLSRLTRHEMTRRPVNLSSLASQITGELARQDTARNVKVTIKPNIVVDGDEKLLAVALENLIGNAWKFTARRDDAKIEIGARRDDGQTVYFVRDNGVGFDMKYADKLFGPFQRLHQTADFPGTGIGLATVQRIINRHGGRVWAESKPGRGATFFFTLLTKRGATHE